MLRSLEGSLDGESVRACRFSGEPRRGRTASEVFEGKKYGWYAAAAGGH